MICSRHSVQHCDHELWYECPKRLYCFSWTEIDLTLECEREQHENQTQLKKISKCFWGFFSKKATTVNHIKTGNWRLWQSCTDIFMSAAVGWSYAPSSARSTACSEIMASSCTQALSCGWMVRMDSWRIFELLSKWPNKNVQLRWTLSTHPKNPKEYAYAVCSIFFRFLEPSRDASKIAPPNYEVHPPLSYSASWWGCRTSLPLKGRVASMLPSFKLEDGFARQM